MDALSILGSPKEFRQSIGIYTPADVQVRADKDQRLAQKIEAGMILARSVTGEDGKREFLRVPPALVLAILDLANTDEDPFQFTTSVLS